MKLSRNEQEALISLKLNLNERFLLINVIGSMLSTRHTIRPLIDLLDSLSLSREESSIPNLDLKYDQNTQKFSWNESMDVSKTITIPEFVYGDIVNALINNSLSGNNSSEIKELIDNIAKQLI